MLTNKQIIRLNKNTLKKNKNQVIKRRKSKLLQNKNQTSLNVRKHINELYFSATEINNMRMFPDDASLSYLHWDFNYKL